MHVRGGLITAIATSLLFTASLPVVAEDVWLDKLSGGYRLGATLQGNNADYRQYEIFFSYDMPWEVTFAHLWQLESEVEISFMLQEDEDDKGGKIAMGGNLLLFSPERRWMYAAGLGGGLLFEKEIGEVDFAGPIFFLFNGGLSYWLSPRLALGYRYHHESNGSIYGKNPSVNMHYVEVRLNF